MSKHNTTGKMKITDKICNSPAVQLALSYMVQLLLCLSWISVQRFTVASTFTISTLLHAEIMAVAAISPLLSFVVLDLARCIATTEKAKNIIMLTQIPFLVINLLQLALVFVRT